MGEIQLRGQRGNQTSSVQQRGKHPATDEPQFRQGIFGFADQSFQPRGPEFVGGRAGLQLGFHRRQMGYHTAPDCSGQAFSSLVLDTEQSSSGRRQLGGLVLALPDLSGQFYLQQRVAERNTRLRRDALEQVSLEGS